MAWILGVDEAGYGPNLGPFVMSAVACQVPAELLAGNLWQLLPSAVRQARARDERLHINDSKAVYATTRGLQALERGVLATLWQLEQPPASLADLITWLCPDDQADLAAEAWYRGVQVVPAELDRETLPVCRALFASACSAAGLAGWQVRSVVVCPSRFNRLLDVHGSKGAILSHGLCLLLRHLHTQLPGEGPLAVFVDKHGGRNSYQAFLAHTFPGTIVRVEQESAARSVYQVSGTGREVKLTFQPRADREHFCVALASMVSKYLRELLMLELNRFWKEHLPSLKATAGYPVDAARFLADIQATAQRLGIATDALWRRK
jgi:hypothetical protein